MSKSKVTVVGSINMDLVTETPRVPRLGETLIGTRFSTVPGGKGANQAVACARLGADVTMVGCVGGDGFGQELIDNLSRENVHTRFVERIDDVSTGIAVITIANSDNSIIVVPGANHHLTPDSVRRAEEAIEMADIVLLQLEIPLETVRETVTIAHRHGVPVILNPAPAAQLPQDLLDQVTVLTPNEHELAVISGEQADRVEGFTQLIQAFAGEIVMTKGSEGVYYKDDKQVVHVPSFAVEVVDTTGAGDSFNAGLAVKLSQGTSLREAVRYAVAVGALSVTKFGAQGGMPTEKDVAAFLRDKSY
ncbi:ribokinase [Numidum massiliense]|uniref:ribokinase n=1 Tax=Numidum massiliense TaxID=1522315 RepID=UPI0006D53040|nr:ribokinase [Numidum massiliense]